MSATREHTFFRALPPYLGGKRRLVPAIFGALHEVAPRREWPGQVLLDPFCGGGSVSLYAKAQGFQVHANDLALRSFVVSKALVENSELRLARTDLLRLFGGSADPELLAVARGSLSERQSRFIAGAIPAARTTAGAKRWLALLTLVKWLLQAFPMSSPAATDAARAAALDLDSISPNRVAHYLQAQAAVSPASLWRIAERVNAGVMPGAGTASQMDARDFLRSETGDIVYLDPPYAGTARYENEYQLLDRLLQGEAMNASEFSSSRPPLAELLDAASYVPVWVVSFAGAGADELVRLIRARRRHVVVRQVAYRHLAALSPKRIVYEYVITAVD